MTNDNQALSFIYLLGCLIIVASALAVRRIPLRNSVKMALAWVLIFVAAFAAFTLKDDFLDLGRRVVAEGRGEAVTAEQGGALRVRQASDGHYWVDALVNGKKVRFLVDSGATITSISSATAERVHVEPSDAMPETVSTGNGPVRVRPARIDELALGPITRHDFRVHIHESGDDDLNVLGMNFLSTLSSWSVEQHWLVLKP